MSSRMFPREPLSLYVAPLTCGLIAVIRSLADSTFSRPTSSVRWMICRWRFVKSTWSKPTPPSRPRPAAARYRPSGEPKPPAPMSRMPASLSFCWPSMPTSGMIRCRLYRKISSFVRSAISECQHLIGSCNIFQQERGQSANLVDLFDEVLLLQPAHRHRGAAGVILHVAGRLDVPQELERIQQLMLLHPQLHRGFIGGVGA